MNRPLRENGGFGRALRLVVVVLQRKQQGQIGVAVESTLVGAKIERPKARREPVVSEVELLPSFDNPFFLAAYAGNAAVLKRLKDAGAKIDDPMTLIGTSRTTPLLGAYKFGDAEVARILFELGTPLELDRKSVV